MHGLSHSAFNFRMLQAHQLRSSLEYVTCPVLRQSSKVQATATCHGHIQPKKRSRTSGSDSRRSRPE